MYFNVNVLTKIHFKNISVNVAPLNNFDFKDISLIKIDAEGNEKEVLLGMKKYLVKDIILIIEKSKRSFIFCKNFLNEYGFECFRFYKKAFDRNYNKALNVYFLKKDSVYLSQDLKLLFKSMN